MEFHRKSPFALRFVSWCFALFAVVFTGWSQRVFFVPLKGGPDLFRETAPEELRVAEGLEAFVEKRMASLQNVLNDAESREFPEENAALLYRPALAVKAIAVDGRRAVAVVAVEGAPQTRVVHCGDEVEGILISDIAPEGITCQWRRQSYFVPLL